MPSKFVAPPLSAVMWISVTIAGISGSATIPAAIGTARSVSLSPKRNGSKNIEPGFCLSLIFIWFSPCRTAKPPSTGALTKTATNRN